MTQNSDLNIELNKFKILFIALGGFGFVLIGVWFLNFDTWFIKLLGLISILFFGLCGIYGLIKLFDKKFGLEIRNEGIYDNSSAIGGHLIKWKDIIEFHHMDKFLLIESKDPDYYLKSANWFKKFWMILNYRFYGTPLCISKVTLKGDFNKIAETIVERFNEAHGIE